MHPEIVPLLDEPLGDCSILPTYLLCRETRRQVTVALGGDGGDELLAGYAPFHALRKAEWYAKFIPKSCHTAIRVLADRLPASFAYMSFDFKVKKALQGLSYPPPFWNPVWLAPLERHEIAELLQEPVNPEELYAEAIECWDAGKGLGLVDQTIRFFTKLYLQDDILC